MRDLLGGKGANVAEMTRILGPERVPAGFTITTEACVAYMDADRTEPEGLAEQVDEAVGRLEEQAGKRLGDPRDPLLVSVRSGARESMPGMLDTVLNLGLNDESVEGLARNHRERALRVGLLPAVRADVRQRRPRHPGRALRGRDRGAQARCGRGARHRARRRCPARPRRGLQGPVRGGLPPGSRPPAARVDPCGLRLLDRGARGGLPAHQSHPRRLGHRGERAADGVREQGRLVVLRRGVQPRRGDRGAGPERRLPRERAGGGRGVRRAHAARHRRDAAGDARGARGADGDPAHARAPLRGHAGHRVHRRGRAPLHAPDTRRQAAGPGGGALRRRRGRGGPAVARGGADDHRCRGARDAAAPDVRARRRLRGAGDGGGGIAGRRQGRDRVQRARRGRRGRRGARRDPRAPVHRGRGRGGLPRRPGDPHQHGRQGQPRRAGGARDGQAVRGRRRRPEGGPQRRADAGGGDRARARATRSS